MMAAASCASWKSFRDSLGGGGGLRRRWRRREMMAAAPEEEGDGGGGAMRLVESVQGHTQGARGRNPVREHPGVGVLEGL